MGLYRHGIIQDLNEMLEESGFVIEAYETSLKIKHKFFDFAIFMHKGWLRFSDVFRMKATYKSLTKFVNRMVNYIYKKFKVNLLNNLKKFEVVAKKFLKDNNITEVKAGENLSESEKRRMRQIQDIRTSATELFGWKPKKVEDLEYKYKIIGTDMFIKIMSLIDITVRNKRVRIYKLTSLSRELAEELAYKFLDFMGYKKEEIRYIECYSRSHPVLLNSLGVFY